MLPCSGYSARQRALSSAIPSAGAGRRDEPGRHPGTSHPCGFCLASDGSPCYDRPMRAFVCEVDHHGLRRLVAEDPVPGDDLRRYARARFPWPTTVARALLDDGDAEDLRAEILAG